jgi:ankyrin repeat protein
MLLNAGANPDIKNKTGQTACELIKSNKALYNTEVYLRLKDFENGRGNRTNRENT